MLFKRKNKYEEKILTKSKNNFPIRVIYKKIDKPPKVKVIDNVFKLKKAIITRNLDIIPYENLYIICNNKKLTKPTHSNIYLPLNTILGDLILVNIDKKEREFKSLSQEEIIWYTKDLINKSYTNINNNINSTKKLSTKNFKQFYERNFENENNSFNFEKTLLNILINIESFLANILKNNGDIKNG